MLLGVAAIFVYGCCLIEHVEAHQGVAFIHPRSSNTMIQPPTVMALEIPRGGKIIDDDESEYDTDDDEEEESDFDSDEEEEDINITKSLKSSAMKASTKAKKQKVSATKKAVSESLSKKKSKASSTAVKKNKKMLLRIPYILKALLNPFTVFAMTKGYFASLFNIDYLQEVCTQF